jgi:polyisoprenoid-binding protein YceI
VRRPRLRWLLLAAFLVLALAVGGVIWYVFGDTSPGKPQLSSTATTDVAPGSATPVGTWNLVRAKDVYVGYRIQELFAGDTIHKDAVGRTPTVDGTMTITPGQVASVDVNADLGNLTSGRSARDDYIHTHAIESDKFPTARFELASPIVIPAGVRPGTKLPLRAAGQLTLHGVTRDVTATLNARWNGSTIDVVGTAPIVLADYGIQPPQTSVTSVGDQGTFELQLRFRHAR